MRQDQSFELFTYSPVRDSEEPRWKETGIPNAFLGSIEEVRAEIIGLQDDLEAAGEEPLSPIRIEKIETLPMSQANLLILLNNGIGAFLKSYEVVETLG